MDILLRQVRVIDPSSPFHQQEIDILVQNGHITDLGRIDRKVDKIISSEGLHASPGWLDCFSHFCDPGFEYKETLESGANAAAAGGYTDVMVLPNTAPVLHNKSGIEYIVQKSSTLPVSVHPIAAVTKNAEGKELAEMYDMQNSGAVAYSDGGNAIQSPGLLLKALQYVKAISKTIIQLPDDRSISAHGLMNEGIVSTQLGLPGKPGIAEELMVSRDIELLKYSESKLHITGISTAKSVELIRQAKSEGLSISCSITPFHLCFTDEDLKGYDTNLKLNPPLRSKSDQEALKKGIRNGTIDCIASHHLPEDIDHKIVEFESARYGMIGLETSFAVVRSCMSDLPLDKLVALFSTNSRKIFGLEAPSLQKNAVAKLSLFAPDAKWTVNGFQSKSKNSVFGGKELYGKPIGIVNKDKLFLND